MLLSRTRRGAVSWRKAAAYGSRAAPGQELLGRENHVIESQRPVGPPPRSDRPKTAPCRAVCPVCRCALIRSKPCSSTMSRRYADPVGGASPSLERARDGFASSTQSLSWAVHGNAPLLTTASLQADDLSIEFFNYVTDRNPIYISEQKATHRSLD
jgi:hypothetical protein